MSLTGKLTTTNTGYKGFIADLTFDAEVRLVPNPRKTKDNHPDFRVMATNVAGREIEVGGAWNKVSEAGNDYVSIGITTLGRKLNCNAVTDTAMR